MVRRSSSRICTAFVACLLLAIAALEPLSVSGQLREAGRITALIPQSLIHRAQQTVEAAKDSTVFWQDEIETMKGARARISLKDGSIINVGSQARMRILQHDEAAQQSSISLSYGKVRASVVKLGRPESKFEIKTPQAVCGVVGTDEYLEATVTATTVISLEGLVVVGSSDPSIPGTVTLRSGEMTVVATGRPPTPPAAAPVEKLYEAVEETEAAPVARLAMAQGQPGETIESSLEGEHLLPVAELKVSGESVSVALSAGATDTHLPLTITVAADATPGARTIVLKTPKGEVTAVFIVLAPAVAQPPTPTPAPTPTPTPTPTPATPTRAPATAIIEGQWWSEPQAPPETITGGSVSIPQGARVLLDGSKSSAPGGAISSYSWEIENSTLRATGTTFDIDTWRLTPGTYRVVLRVTGADGSTGRGELTLVVRGLLNPDDTLSGLRAAYESLQVDQFMRYFDSTRFRGYPSLEENIRNFLQSVSSMRVYLRIDNRSVVKDEATYGAAFEIDFTAKNNPTVQKRTESLTIRMQLIREPGRERWAIVDYSAVVSGVAAGEGQASGSIVVAPQASVPSAGNPDFFVSAMSVAGALAVSGGFPQLIAGTPVEIFATIKNQGSGEASDIPVRFRIGGVDVGTLTVSHLDAGASSDISLRATVPSTLSGTQSVTVFPNPDFAISESDTSNNERSLTFEIVTRGFSISLDPTNAQGTPGQTVSYRVTVRSSGGFSDAVALSVANLPANVTAQFSPAQVTPTESGVLSSLVLTITALAAPGTFDLLVVGTSGALAQNAAFSLTINPLVGPPPDFSMFAEPDSQSVVAGQTANYTVTLTALNNFNVPVTLSVTGLPAGATANFTVNLLTPSATGNSVRLDVATGTAAPGTSQLTIIGASGTLQHAAQVSLTILAQGQVTVSISPISPSVRVGETVQFTATVLGISNTAVTWSVNGTVGGNATVGTISTAGLYTAPSTVPTTTVRVRATSVVDSNALAETNVTIFSGIVVAVNPSGVELIAGGVQQFTATVTGTNNTAVTWSVSGVLGGNSTVGTITATGLYTAPGAVPSPPTVTVTATSVVDPSNFASATVTIFPSSGGFRVVVTPTNQTVAPGGRTTYVVRVTSIGGFSAPVSFELSHPNEIDHSHPFSPSTVTPTATGVDSILSVAAISTAPPAVYRLVVIAVGGGLTVNTEITLTVSGATAGSFSLTTSPDTRTSPLRILGGGSGTLTLTLVPGSGFSGTVNLSAAAHSAVTSVTFNPPAVGNTSGASLTSQVTFTLDPGAVESSGGNIQIELIGTSGSLTSSNTVAIAAVGPLLTQNPNTRVSPFVVTAGGSGTVTIGFVSINGFSGTIDLSASQSFVVRSMTFSPSTIGNTGGAASTSQMRIEFFPDAPPGQYIFNIQGRAGTALTATEVFVQVSSFSLITVPDTQLAPPTVAPGATVNLTVTMNPEGGFVGNVTLSAGLPGGISSITFNPTTIGNTQGAAQSSQVTVQVASTATAGRLATNIFGTSSTAQAAVSLFIDVVTGPSFSMAITPITSFVQAGQAATYTVTLTSFNGFANPVTLSTGGLPSGSTASFGSTQLTPTAGGVSTTLAVTTSTSSSTGTFFFSVFATGDSIQRHADVPITILMSAVQLNASPPEQDIVAGQTASYVLFVSPVGDFTANVTLALQGLPANATVNFVPSATVAVSNVPVQVVANVMTTSSTPTGRFDMFFTAEGGGRSARTDVILRVGSAGFRLDVTPATSPSVRQNVQGAGSPVAVQVTVVPIGGFVDPVTLNVESIISDGGVNVTPATTVVSPGGSATFTVTAERGTQVGPAQFDIIGITSLLVQAVTVFLNVTPAPDFVLSTSPVTSLTSPLNVQVGGAAVSLTVSLTGQNGFGGTVPITAQSFSQAGISASPLSIGLSPGGSAVLMVSATAGTPLGGATFHLVGNFNDPPPYTSIVTQVLTVYVNVSSTAVVTPGVEFVKPQKVEPGTATSESEGDHEVGPRGKFSRETVGALRAVVWAVEPHAMEAGSRILVLVSGKNLEGVSEVSGAGGAIRGVIAGPVENNQVAVELRVAADLTPGSYLLTFSTGLGSATAPVIVAARGSLESVMERSALEEPAVGPEGGGESGEGARPRVFIRDPSLRKPTARALLRPDLIVSADDVRISPALSRAGEPVTVRVEVRNEGTARAEGVVVEFAAGDGPRQRETVDLGPGQSARIPFEWTPAGGRDSGTPTITIDPGNRIAESDETNNVAQLAGERAPAEADNRLALRQHFELEVKSGGCAGVRLSSATPVSCGQGADVEFELSPDGSRLVLRSDGTAEVAAPRLEAAEWPEVGRLGRGPLVVRLGGIYAVAGERQAALLEVRSMRSAAAGDGAARRGRGVPRALDVPRLGRDCAECTDTSRTSDSSGVMLLELEWVVRLSR